MKTIEAILEEIQDKGVTIFREGARGEYGASNYVIDDVINWLHLPILAAQLIELYEENYRYV